MDFCFIAARRRGMAAWAGTTAMAAAAPSSLRALRTLRISVTPLCLMCAPGLSRSRSVLRMAQGAAGSNGRPSVAESGTAAEKSRVEEGYVGLFVRMLGLDNPIEDREEAVDALWRHSEGGKDNVDEILNYPGCLNLVVSLIPSDRPDASEAAAGLLRQVSSINCYRPLVAEAGAIEEVTGLLTRKSAPAQVREQATCVLWNLSAEENYRENISNPELLPVLISMLESEEQGEQDAAAGVLANLALSESNHNLLLEAGALPKFAKLLKADLQKVSKVARQGARNALLELSKRPEAKLAVIEEGLMFVPIIGANAYKSLKPHLIEAAPSVPENIKLDRALGSQESDFGAGDVLLGLHIADKEQDVDEATQLAMEGRNRLRFLTRLGLLEKEGVDKEKQASEAERKHTIMPWWDAIPRLVLILGLEDVTYAKQGAEAIAELAITEDNRQAIAKAGAIPHLAYLLGSGDESVMEAAAHAIEKLSISHKVREAVDAFGGVVSTLVAVAKAEDVPESLQDKVLGALVCLSQTGEEVKSGNIPGILDIVNSEDVTDEGRAEAENVLKEISSPKSDPRDKIVAAGGVPALVKLLSGGSLSLKEKAAAVLENIASKEAHAISIAEGGVDSALKSIFEVKLEEGLHDDSIWLVVCAASRLLGKLLNFKSVRNLLDCPSHVMLLSMILKGDKPPLYVKDWVSVCLLKLANSTIAADLLDVPINLEVTVHDVIPRLLEEMKTKSAEEAVLQLRDLVSCGVPDYVATVANSGGIFPVVEVLGNGSSSARDAALSILYSLGVNEENHPAIVAAGAVPILERVVKAEAGEWKLALDLLRLLPTS